MRFHFFTRAGLAATAAAALVTLAPKPSHAEQFTLFDVTFDFTWEDAINATPSKSHYYVKTNMLSAQRPSNWVTPIDYRNGKVHIHLEVLEKPEGGQKQGWALCYVGGGSYGCPYSKYYTEKGTYDSEVDMTAFYNNATIDWTKGISEVDLVYTINDSGSGHVHFFPELKDKTTPTKVRIAMVQLSKGSTYDAGQLPGGGMGGGGAGGGAGTSGAAGAAGSAGAGGSGGAAGSASLGGAGSGGAPAAVQAGAGGAAVVPILPQGGVAPSAGVGGSPAGAGGSPASNPAAPSGADDAGCALGGRGAPFRAAGLSLLGLALIWRARRRA